MAIGPDRILKHYQGFEDFTPDRKIAYVVMEFERIIDAHIVYQNYRTLAFFSGDNIDFEWPMVEASLREGFVAYHFEFKHDTFGNTFNRQERMLIYRALRKRYKNEGWQNVYFEYIDGHMHIALMRDDKNFKN